jgi:hypothetical protein
LPHAGGRRKAELLAELAPDEVTMAHYFRRARAVEATVQDIIAKLG